MKTYTQEGKAVTLTAPVGGVVKGYGYVIGALFVVALNTADAGDDFEGYTTGVYELPKESTAAFTVGEKVFWDNTAKECDETATGRFMVGVAVEAAIATTVVCKVRLDGIAVTAV